MSPNGGLKVDSLSTEIRQKLTFGFCRLSVDFLSTFGCRFGDRGAGSFPTFLYPFRLLISKSKASLTDQPCCWG